MMALTTYKHDALGLALFAQLFPQLLQMPYLNAFGYMPFYPAGYHDAGKLRHDLC